MNGLSTGNTLYDALILLVPVVLAFLANRYGLGWLLVAIGEQLVRLKPTPQPEQPKPVDPVAPVNGQSLQFASLPGKPVALEWFALIQMLLPLILQIVEMFRQQTGRTPTAKEVSAILVSGKVDEFMPVQMPTVPPVVE